MKVEYDLAKAPVSYEQEKQLGEDPLRLDFLIVMKEDDTVLSDPIGSFFKKVNLFEYKSPEDGLTIDDFYKAQGYGLIYKGFDRKVNELPIEQLTLTLVRHRYPKELFKVLRAEGYMIISDHAGIYKIEGRVSIPVQIVVSSRLPEGEYAGLKLLSGRINREDIIRYTEATIISRNENIKENAGTVISVCLSANKELGKELKEEGTMDELVREFFDKVETKMKEREENVQEESAEKMIKDNVPVSNISKWTGLSVEKITAIAKKIGAASL